MSPKRHPSNWDAVPTLKTLSPLEEDEGRNEIEQFERLISDLYADDTVLHRDAAPGVDLFLRRRVADFADRGVASASITPLPGDFLPPPPHDQRQGRPRVFDGQRIRTQRLRMGLSQEALASRAGVDERTLRRIEASQSSAPHGETVRVFAEALGCSVADLFEGRDSVSEARTEPRICSVCSAAEDDADGRYCRRCGRFLDAPSSSGLEHPYEGEAADLQRVEESLLLQAQKMDALARLVNSVAHEFSTFFQTITGFADMASQRLKATSLLYAWNQEIRIASERGSLVMQQLLSATRRGPMHPEWIDVNKVVRGLLLLLERTIGDNLRLQLQLDPELAPVRADPEHIVEVIVNLVENSREASLGGGLIEIGTANAVKSGPSGRGTPSDVRLWVRDQGRGMDDETRARALEPFFTTKTAGRVSGLGLTTVYSIVRQSGGTLSIASSIGRGTTVTIELPRDQGFAPEAVSATAGVPETILLVVDDGQVRTLARQTLEEAGYHVVATDNAVAALESLDSIEAPIALLVADVAMPDLDGRLLADQMLRRRSELRGVIYVSDHPDVVFGALPGQVAFLRKPFRPGNLLSAVRRAIS